MSEFPLALQQDDDLSFTIFRNIGFAFIQSQYKLFEH